MTDKKVVEVCVHPWPYPYHAGRFIFCGKCGGELELIGDGRDAADHVAEVDRLTKQLNDHHSRDIGRDARTPQESIDFINSDHPCCLPIGDVCQITGALRAAEQRISELTSANEEKAKKIADLIDSSVNGCYYVSGVPLTREGFVKRLDAILNGGQQ